MQVMGRDEVLRRLRAAKELATNGGPAFAAVGESTGSGG